MTNDYLRHFEAAEKLLSEAKEADTGFVRADRTAQAQVHATLALAAATRDNGVVTVREDRP